MGCRCLGEGSGCIGKRDNGLAVFGADVKAVPDSPSPPMTHTGSTSPTFHMFSLVAIGRHFAAYSAGRSCAYGRPGQALSTS